MKNILRQKATDEQHGRTKYILTYVDKRDIKNKEILDIGCGFGWFEYNMLNNLKEGHIWGIDLTKGDIKIAKDTVKDKRIIFQAGSALNLPFQDESFDCIVSWDVIEHIPRNMEEKMFSEISRVLKKGGKFYLSTPYRNFLSTCLDPAWWLIGHRHYTIKKIKDIVKGIPSLKLKQLEVRGGIWDVLGILNMYISKWIFKRRLIYKNYFINKIDREYKRGNGISTLFICGKKL